MDLNSGRLEHAKRSLAERGAAVLPLALAVALAVIRLSNSEPVDRAGEPLATLAFAGVIGLPGILSWRAARGRPALYLAAGILATLFAFISLAGVSLPLLIPAAMSFVSYGRHAGEARGPWLDPLVAMICVVLGIASFAVLFLVHEDPGCASTATGSSCSSDVVTAAEAAISILCLTVTVALGSVLSRPRDQKPPR